MGIGLVVELTLIVRRTQVHIYTMNVGFPAFQGKFVLVGDQPTFNLKYTRLKKKKEKKKEKTTRSKWNNSKY